MFGCWVQPHLVQAGECKLRVARLTSRGGAHCTPHSALNPPAPLLPALAQVWEDAVASKCEVDCRLCTTLIEVCGRKGDTDRALQAYAQVSPPRAVYAGISTRADAWRGLTAQ